MKSMEVRIRNLDDFEFLKNYVTKDGLERSNNQIAEFAVHQWADFLPGEFDTFMNTIAAAKMIALFGIIGFDIIGYKAATVSPDERGKLSFIFEGSAMQTAASFKKNFTGRDTMH